MVSLSTLDNNLLNQNSGIKMDKKFIISEIKVSIIKTQSAGADYMDHAKAHWINDTIIANPMSKYPEYYESRSSWGMDAIKGISSTITPFNEFINLHPTAEKIVPIFGSIFTNEPVPINGEVALTDLPGFGVEFNDAVELEEI